MESVWSRWAEIDVDHEDTQTVRQLDTRLTNAGGWLELNIRVSQSFESGIGNGLTDNLPRFGHADKNSPTSAVEHATQ